MAFTFEYVQPPEYHFCQDSILLPKFVAEVEGASLSKDSRVLDLCAGCGVIGFELKYYVPQLRHLDFLEIQPEFAAYLERNKILTGTPNARLLAVNYSKLRELGFANQYDLIMSNPPYFFADDGRLSPCAITNRCRFFLDSDFETLIEGTLNALKPFGRAYLLIKDGGQHGRKAVRDIQLILSARAEVDVATAIRGTNVVRIKKISGG